MSGQIIVIPDLHGRLDLLKATLQYFPMAHYLSLGDAIDRGTENVGTVKLLMELYKEGRATLLTGNHEHMAATSLKLYREYLGTHDLGDYRRAMEKFQSWMKAGGHSMRQELGSLTLEQFPAFLEEYFQVLHHVVYVTASGAIYAEPPPEPSVLVSHAAPPIQHVNYPNPLSAALWLRPFEGPFPLPEGVVYSLHGHTPVRTPTRLERHVYTDLGAYETGRLALIEIGDPQDFPKITALCGRGSPELALKYIKFGQPIPVNPIELPNNLLEQ